MTQRVSVHDVAARAGVSVGTVSHALNHPDRLAASTLERVQQAIDELGFIRSGTARQLRAGSSSTIALVVEDITNPFYIESARAIEQVLATHDLAMVLCSTEGNPAKQQRMVRMLLEHQVRGVIVAAEQGSDEVARALLQRNLRVVLMDSPGRNLATSSVGVDDVEGGRLAVAHLLANRRRSISVLTGDLSIRQAKDRWEGARLAVTQAGLVPDEVLTLVSERDFTALSGARGMERALTHNPLLDAVFCGNDPMAIGAMRVLRQRGIAIGEAVDLVGYDDVPVAQELITPLTSVRQPLEDLGRTAAEMVCDPSDEVEHVLFPPELVVRDSAPRR